MKEGGCNERWRKRIEEKSGRERERNTSKDEGRLYYICLLSCQNSQGDHATQQGRSWFHYSCQNYQLCHVL